MKEEGERLMQTVDKPLEDAGMADPTTLIGGMQVRGAKATITIGREAFKHAVKRHAFWSIEKNVSRFNAGENMGKLIRAADGVARSPARGKNFQRVVDAGRDVGIDRASGKPAEALHDQTLLRVRPGAA